MHSHTFFYKFDSLSLTPGNKTAGFGLQVSTSALVALASVPLGEEERARMFADAHQRVRHAGLLPARIRASLGIMFHNDSYVPRYFASGMFGGSIGADPETFSRLDREDPHGWLSDVVEYTPHNIDTPKNALALTLLAQTWAEWADRQLAAVAHRHRAPLKLPT